MNKFFIIFFLCLVPNLCFSQSFKSELGTCRKARTDKDAKKSPHIFFTIGEGRKLLKSMAGWYKDSELLKVNKKKVNLLRDMVELYKARLVFSENSRKEVLVRSEKLSKKNVKLAKEKEGLKKDVARLEREKWTNLLIGIGIGAGIVATAAVIIVLVK